MTANSTIFEMPPVMKLEDCETLHCFLQEQHGQAVALDCAAVDRMTGLAAQLVVFAHRKWSSDGVSFALRDVSNGCRDSLTALGLAALLTQEGAMT